MITTTVIIKVFTLYYVGAPAMVQLFKPEIIVIEARVEMNLADDHWCVDPMWKLR
jgi:hypothetical protein